MTPPRGPNEKAQAIIDEFHSGEERLGQSLDFAVALDQLLPSVPAQTRHTLAKYVEDALEAAYRRGIVDGRSIGAKKMRAVSAAKAEEIREHTLALLRDHQQSFPRTTYDQAVEAVIDRLMIFAIEKNYCFGNHDKGRIVSADKWINDKVLKEERLKVVKGSARKAILRCLRDLNKINDPDQAED